MANRNALFVPLGGGRGAAMPEYGGGTRLPDVVAPGAGASARLSDAAAASIGAAARGADAYWQDVHRLGQAIHGAAKTGYDVYLEYEMARARQVFNEYQAEAVRKQAELSTLKGQDALGENGVRAQFAAWQKQARARCLKGFGTAATRALSLQLDSAATHYDHWGAGYERQELGVYQNSVDEGAIRGAMDMAERDPAQLMASLGRIRATCDGMARRNGWDTGLADAKYRDAASRMFTGVVNTTLASGDIAGARRLLEQYGRHLTPQQMAHARNSIDNTILRQVDSLARAGDFEGARRVAAQGNAYGGVGSIAMRYESGGNVAAISPDTSGSKSYGKYQFNTLGKGTAHTFMQYVAKAHPDLYAALGGGKLTVGSAEFDAAWKQASATMREEMGKAQDEHMAAAYLKPVREKLSGLGLPGAIEKSAAFQEMALSTAIQHGPGGAARILREAWGAVDKSADPQSQLRQFIETTYAYRGRPGEFRTAEAEKPGTLQAMRSRFAREMRDVLSMAGGTQADGKPPVYALSTPQATAELEAKMAGIAKMEHAHNVERMSASVWEQTTGLSVERRRAAAVDMVGTMSDDPKTQGEVMALFDRNLKFQEIQEKAADGRAVNAFIEQAQKQQWTPSQILAELEKNAEMSDAAKAAAREHFFGEPKAGPQDDARSRAALSTLYRAIDENPDLSDARIEAFAFENRLTTEQTKAALKYKADGGNIGGLSLSKVEGIYKRATGKKEMPEGIFEQVVAQIEPGKKPTERDLMQIVANTVMSGESMGAGWRGLWDKDESYGDALKAGRGDVWLPDIKDADERDALKNALPGNARVNDFNLRLLKKRNMGIKDTRPWSEEQ